MRKSKSQRKQASTLTSLKLWLISCVTFSAIIAGYVPLLLTHFLIIFTVLVLAYFYSHDPVNAKDYALHHLKKLLGTPFFRVILAFCLYIFLSCFWAAKFSAAISKAALLVLIIMAIYSGLALAKSISQSQLRLLSKGILIGLLLGLVFPCLELASNFTFLNFLADHFPGSVKVGTNGQVPRYYLNRNVAVLAIFFWPALLAIFFWKGKNNWRPLLTVLLVMMTLLAIYLSDSETAKLSFIIGSLAFLIAFYFPDIIYRLVQSLWLIAVMGVVPLIMLLYWAGLQNVEQLPYSARDRIYIWHYTAEKIPQNLLLGIGIRSDRFSKKKTPPPLARKSKKKLQDHKGWHSHNMFLQVWYELGAIGALFFLIIGLLLLQKIKDIQREIRPFAYAAFAGCSTTAAFGYGMWQSWLLSAYAWCIIFLIIVITIQDTFTAPVTAKFKN